MADCWPCQWDDHLFEVKYHIKPFERFLADLLQQVTGNSIQGDLKGKFDCICQFISIISNHIALLCHKMWKVEWLMFHCLTFDVIDYLLQLFASLSSTKTTRGEMAPNLGQDLGTPASSTNKKLTAKMCLKYCWKWHQTP